jgi:hypothetical protein
LGHAPSRAPGHYRIYPRLNGQLYSQFASLTFDQRLGERHAQSWNRFAGPPQHPQPQPIPTGVEHLTEGQLTRAIRKRQALTGV